MRNTNNTATKSEVLAIIDTYEGMIRLEWSAGRRAESLLAERGKWVAALAQMEGR